MAKDIRVKIKLSSNFTDGDCKYWPKPPFMEKCDDLYYHEKVADMWMKHIGKAVPSQKYVLDRLPGGYAIFCKARNNDKTRVDRYLFGHPKKAFCSPNEFINHFRWLMLDGNGYCACIYCSENKRVRRPGPSLCRQSSTSRESTKRKRNIPRRTSDDFASIIELYLSSADEKLKDDLIVFGNKYTRDKLQAGRTFEEIAEGYLKLPSFLPRVGELVLFYANGPRLARFELETQRFRLFNPFTKKFGTCPKWKAGVISQEPQQPPNVENLKVTFADQIPKDRHHYLIDLFPDPDGEDKSLSGHIYHVSIDHIRPLSMYHEMLSGIPQELWDETIHNALKVMSSVAVVDPIILRREDAKVIVECRGVWVGSELWIKGDAVRMKSENGIPIHGALIIDGIDLIIENADILRSSVYIWGRAYSIDEDYTFNNEEGGKSIVPEHLKNRPSCFDGYNWYSMCDPNEDQGEEDISNIKEEPCESFLGRLYESKAMEALVGTSHFDVAQESIRQVRAWALHRRHYDQWIANQNWLIMNDRLEMLGIDALHGQHVPSNYDFVKIERQNLNAEALLRLNKSSNRGMSDKESPSVSIHNHKADESTYDFISAIIEGEALPLDDEDDDIEILEVRKVQTDTYFKNKVDFETGKGESIEQTQGTKPKANGTYVPDQTHDQKNSRKQQNRDICGDEDDIQDKYNGILVKRVRLD